MMIRDSVDDVDVIDIPSLSLPFSIVCSLKLYAVSHHITSHHINHSIAMSTECSFLLLFDDASCIG